MRSSAPTARSRGPWPAGASRWSLAALGLSVVLSVGCQGNVIVTFDDTLCPHRIDAECIGVPAQPLCSASECTDGVSCDEVVKVSSDAELTAAASGASPGTCIALAPGDYGSVSLPAGVALLGRGADFVRLGAVTLQAGPGAVVRGLQIGSGGLELDGATGVEVFGVRIASSSADAIVLSGGAGVTIDRSDVSRAGDFALRAVDFGALTIVRSWFGDAAGLGIWAQCATGCDCASKPPVTLEYVLLERTALLGVSLLGVSAELRKVHILETITGQDFEADGALAIAGCSEAEVRGLTVSGSAYYGVLVDQASADLGGAASGEGLTVERTMKAVIINDISSEHAVTVTNATLTGNSGVGFCISNFSTGVTILDSVVQSTSLATVPTQEGGSATVGDALQWTGGSEVLIDGLIASSSARQSVLIDGPVGPGSRIDGLSLAGGDEQTGIVQQNVLSPSVAPELGAGVPAVEQHDSTVFDVACP